MNEAFYLVVRTSYHWTEKFFPNFSLKIIPLWGDSKTFGIPEAKGLKQSSFLRKYIIKKISQNGTGFHFYILHLGTFCEFDITIAVFLQDDCTSDKIISHND